MYFSAKIRYISILYIYKVHITKSPDMSWFMPGTNHQWAALLHLATWHCTWWWHSSGIVEHGGRVGFCGLVLLQKKMVLPINQTKRQQGMAVCATYESCYSNHVIFRIFRWETLIRWYLLIWFIWVCLQKSTGSSFSQMFPIEIAISYGG